MTSTDITVTLNCSVTGRTTYTGRGYYDYPFVVHRPTGDRPKNSPHGLLDNESKIWKITHMASGKAAFSAPTLSDAAKMITILKGFPLFYMPECPKFIQLCGLRGADIKIALELNGWNSKTGRFE